MYGEHLWLVPLLWFLIHLMLVFMESRLIPVDLRFRSFWVSKAKRDWTRSPLKYLTIRYNKQTLWDCGIYCQKEGRDSGDFKWRSFITRNARLRIRDKLTEVSVDGPEKNGTVTGAIALIIGTSIGSGILALPKKTSPAGFIPSAVSVIFCWGFLLIEALLLAEINVALMKGKKKGKMNKRADFISIRSMAEQTLGEWGGKVATTSYIFLAYTSMVAYTAKSGEILSQLIDFPTSISGIFITTISTVLVSLGGTDVTDRLNQGLTASMLGLLVAVEVIAAASGDWSALTSTAARDKVRAAVPVIIFSLVYHDIAPVICSYLGGDLARIRLSVVVGSLVPLVALLVWNAIALSLSSSSSYSAEVDPVDILMSAGSSELSVLVQTFSLLAVGTSLIGTLLGFTQFFLEQLSDSQLSPLSNQTAQEKIELIRGHPDEELIHGHPDDMVSGLRQWWESNKLNFTVAAMVTIPPLLVSNTVPQAFSAATDIAGGYCMTILYGVLPPAMALALHATSQEEGDELSAHKGNVRKVLSDSMPGLVCMGLLACGVVFGQIVQDLDLLHLSLSKKGN